MTANRLGQTLSWCDNGTRKISETFFHYECIRPLFWTVYYLNRRLPKAGTTGRQMADGVRGVWMKRGSITSPPNDGDTLQKFEHQALFSEDHEWFICTDVLSRHVSSSKEVRHDVKEPLWEERTGCTWRPPLSAILATDPRLHNKCDKLPPRLTCPCKIFDWSLRTTVNVDE